MMALVRKVKVNPGFIGQKGYLQSCLQFKSMYKIRSLSEGDKDYAVQDEIIFAVYFKDINRISLKQQENMKKKVGC